MRIFTLPILLKGLISCVPGGGGVLPGMLGGAVPLGLHILTLFQTEKCHFSQPFLNPYPFSDLPLRNYVIIA